MKKFLSLVMALIMVMSLVTVASAADYTDAADVDKTEAVDVMSAVGVFQGSAGKFNPKAILNRAEAAKLIAYLDLGEKTAEALPAVQSFSDVPATHWAAKYIAYCADAGYINGVGNGKFDPTGKLTGYQFGKLVLCVLGYDATIEAFTGANWSIAVAKLMKSNDINKGVKAAPSTELTREDAAQYCLNALKATTVDYESKGTNITINGVEIATGASKAASVYDTIASGATAIKTGADKDGKYTVELGEKLYEGDLKLDQTGVATDDFGRDATVWTYKTDDIGTYADTADFVFTVDTSASKVAAALKGVKDEYGYKIDNDTKVAAYDNETSAKQISDLTENGKLVEIFVDSDNQIEKILVTEYELGKVTKVSTNSKTGDVTYTITGAGSFVDYADEEKTDEIILNGEIKKDDYVTFKKIDSDKIYVYTTTVKEGVVSKAAAEDYIVLDGVKYPQNYTVGAGKDAVKVWLDQYGVVVYGENADSTVDYVYFTSMWTSTTKGVPTYYAQFVTADGEVKEMKVADYETYDDVELNCVANYETTNGKISTFTKVASGDVVPLVATRSIDEGVAKLTNTQTGGNAYYFADDVTFVYLKDAGDDLKVTTSKAVDKVRSIPANSFAVLDEDGDITTVFIRDKAAASTKGNDLLFMADTESTGSYVNKDNKPVETFEFYLNGEKDDYGVAEGSDDVALGYFSYAVDATTGDLILTAEEDDVYVVTVGLDGSNAYGIVKDTYVNLDGYDVAGDTRLTDVDAVLADDAVIYDTTSNNIASLADIVNVVEDDVSVSGLKLYVLYDAKAENISMIYVVDLDAE